MERRRGLRAGVILLTSLLLSAYVQAQDTLRLTLDSCLRYAYEHSSVVELARLGEERAEVTLHSARWQLLPTVNASAGEYWSQSGDQSSQDFSMGVNASMTLIDGGGRWSHYKRSKLARQQSQLQAQQSRRTVGEEVAEAYLALLMEGERLAYQQHLLETCRRQEAEGRLRYEVGKIMESEYQLIEANLRQAEKERDNLELAIEEDRWRLQVLLGLSEEVAVDVEPLETIPEESMMPTMESVMDLALERQPEMKIAEVGVEIAKQGVRTARAVYFPTLSVSASSSFYGGQQGLVDALGRFINQGGLNSNIGLSVSIPILNYSSASAQMRQSKIDLRQAEVEREQKGREFRQWVKRMYVAAEQSLNDYRVSRQLEQAYGANYEVYRKRYDEGKVGIVEFLQQQDRYLSALNDYLQSKYAYVLNMKMLELIKTEP